MMNGTSVFEYAMSGIEGSGMGVKGIGPPNNGPSILKMDPSKLQSEATANVGLNFTNVGPGGMCLYKKGSAVRSGSKQKGRPWYEHYRKLGHKEDTCWDLYGKPTDWKSRQNNRNRGYQASVNYSTENTQGSNGAFNPEQMEQLYKMFATLQPSS